MNSQEMTLKQYIKQLPEHHCARKEYDQLMNEIVDRTNSQAMGDLVKSNTEVQRDIAEATLAIIARLVRDYNRFHPMHPDTFPPLLEHIRKMKGGT